MNATSAELPISMCRQKSSPEPERGFKLMTSNNDSNNNKVG